MEQDLVEGVMSTLFACNCGYGVWRVSRVSISLRNCGRYHGRTTVGSGDEIGREGLELNSSIPCCIEV